MKRGVKVNFIEESEKRLQMTEEREKKCEKIASEILELLRGYKVSQLEYEFIIKKLDHKVKMIVQNSII